MNPRLLSLALLLFTLPAIAQSNNEIAVGYGRTVTSEVGDAPAIGLSYAHFWNNGLAVRVGGTRATEDYPDNAGDKMFGGYFAVAEYHLFRNRLISPHIGGGLAYAVAQVYLSHSDLTYDDNAYSATGIVGLDVNLTRNFAIGVDSSYVRFDPDLGDRHGSIADPITTLVSVKCRY
jgi:outer membrane protein W